MHRHMQILKTWMGAFEFNSAGLARLYSISIVANEVGKCPIDLELELTLFRAIFGQDPPNAPFARLEHTKRFQVKCCI